MEKKKNILLGDFNKKLPFTVPENYFDKFSTDIEANLMIRPTPVKHLLKPWMYMAAMFVGIFVISLLFTFKSDKQQLTSTDNYELYFASQVDESDIMNYYLNEENNQ